MEITPSQKKKLLRLAKVVDNGDIALLEELSLLEERVEEVAGQIPALRQAVDGYTPVKGVDYFDGEKGDKGDDGKDYILTKSDKKEIAKSITVPVVEKIIEKQETVIREIPIVTKEIIEKEVAVLDEATVAYLEDRINTVEKTKSQYTKDGIGLVVRELRAGAGVTIDNTNQEYPIVSASGGPGGASAWGDITGTLSDQTDLQTALNAKSDTSHTHTGVYAPALGADDNYVTDAEKTKLSNLSGVNTGDQDLSGYALTSHNHTGVYEPADATILKDADIGVTVASQGHTHAGVYAPVSHAHAISDVTGLQTALDGKAPSLGADDNYVTDAEKVKLSNLSGTNTGDQTTIVGITGTKAQFDTAVTDGNFLYTDAIGSTVQAYSAVLAGTTASFTTADETKLDGIEAGADVTDATNVATAGAIMDGDFSTNGLMKRTGAGTYATAVAGTDYVAPDTQITDLASLAYTGNGLKFLRVNTGETAWELATVAGGGDVTGDDTSTTAQNIVAYTGTGGKNITELTGTQGDVLYHNGTSWVKLGAGTVGQFLITGGTGANPSWSYGAPVHVSKSSGVTTTGANVTPVSVSGAVFTYATNATYMIKVMGRLNSTAATTGGALQFDLSSAVTAIDVIGYNTLAATGTTTGFSSIADDTSQSVSSGVPTGPLDVPIVADALLVTGANTGTCQLRFRSETTAVTELLAGVVMVVTRVA